MQESHSSWFPVYLDYNDEVAANASMTDQPESEDKPSSNAALYVLGGISILIVLLWFLTEVRDLRSHADQRKLDAKLPQVEVHSTPANEGD